MSADDPTRPQAVVPGPGTVRAGGLAGFPELVSELGGDPVALIARCGLATRAFADDDNVIPFGVGARLVHVAARETGCPHFGLLLGHRQNLTKLGPIGFLIQHCPDVRTALASLIEHMHLQVTGAVATVTASGRLASFTYRVQLHGLTGVEQVYDICMAYQVRILQLLCGAHWRPEAVHFCYPAPANAKLFREFFGVPVHFDQPSSAVLLSADWLDRPIDGADPALRAILLKHLRQLEAQRGDGLPEKLRQVIRTLLPTGHCTAERVSELFGMHRRTLHRGLARHGTTFEEVVDSLRRDLAIQSLSQAEVKLAQLSEMLGYRDPSAFTRAFRRWTSMSPKEWRAAR